MTYAELAELPAEAYLNPENFVTLYDGSDKHLKNGYGVEQYKKGLKIGQEFDYITLSYKGVWSAGNDDGRSHCRSYEGIGYHACTADLLRGFLDSPARLIVYRLQGDGIKATTFVKTPDGNRVLQT